MKSLYQTLGTLLLALSLTFGVGCGEAEPEPEVVADEEPTPEATTSAAKKTKKKKSYSLIQSGFAAAEKSLDNGDYDKAVQALLKMQLSGQLRNNKDSWRYSQLMSDVQSELSSAAADGDKKAQRAIEMLRQSRGPM